MIVDALVHLGLSHFGTHLDADDAVRRLDAAGSDVGLVVPVHPRGGGLPPANDLVLHAARESGGRMVALARVDPWEGDDAVAEVHRVVAEGARGIALNPREENFQINDQRVRPIVTAAAANGVPVVVAAGTHLLSEPLQLAQAASWAPGNPFVLTNGGQLNISGMMQFDVMLALRNDDIVVHTTAMYRQDFLEGVVTTFGAHRLMHASGTPTYDVRYERARVDALHLGSAERSMVLGGTAERVFGTLS